MKHTPAPWEIGPHHKTIRPEGFDRIGKANGGFVICELFGPDAVDNAYLITTAPELLEDLESRYAQTRCGCGHPACNRCEDDRETERVLRKAKGGGE